MLIRLKIQPTILLKYFEKRSVGLKRPYHKFQHFSLLRNSSTPCRLSTSSLPSSWSSCTYSASMRSTGLLCFVGSASIWLLQVKVEGLKTAVDWKMSPFVIEKLEIWKTFLGILASLALIIFGSLGDSEDFMPDFEQNYLSWSFGLAFVGAFFDFLGAILFMIEARIIRRKEIAREIQYPMEQRV